MDNCSLPEVLPDGEAREGRGTKIHYPALPVFIFIMVHERAAVWNLTNFPGAKEAYRRGGPSLKLAVAS